MTSFDILSHENSSSRYLLYDFSRYMTAPSLTPQQPKNA